MGPMASLQEPFLSIRGHEPGSDCPLSWTRTVSLFPIFQVTLWLLGSISRTSVESIFLSDFWGKY